MVNYIDLPFYSFIKVLAFDMDVDMTNTKKREVLVFSTRSYPTFGRQRKPFDELNPPKGVTDSPYYWWFMFLRLNAGYQSVCKSGGKGALSSIYKDLGDVHTQNFKEWWNQVAPMFAEPKKGYKMMVAKSKSDIAPFDSDEVLNLVVPLNRSQRSLKKSFAQLVLSRIEKGKRGVSVESSGAKYKLSGKWHIEALSTAYKIHSIKLRYENDGVKKAWADIAIEAKLPMTHALAKSDKSINSDVRRTLTILAMRHYDRALKFIQAAASNSFPYVRSS